MNKGLEVLGILALTLIVVLLRMAVVQHAWNLFAPLYGLPLITFGQVYLLTFMAALVSGYSHHADLSEKVEGDTMKRASKSLAHSLGASVMALLMAHFLHWLMF